MGLGEPSAGQLRPGQDPEDRGNLLVSFLVVQQRCIGRRQGQWARAPAPNSKGHQGRSRPPAARQQPCGKRGVGTRWHGGRHRRRTCRSMGTWACLPSTVSAPLPPPSPGGQKGYGPCLTASATAPQTRWCPEPKGSAPEVSERTGARQPVQPLLTYS